MSMHSLFDVFEATGAMEELTPQRWKELRTKAQDHVKKVVPQDIIGRYRDQEAKRQIRRAVQQVVELECPNLPFAARSSIAERLTNDISGYGPLETLLDDPEITEIVCQQYNKILVERRGKLDEADVQFDSEESLRLVIDRIVAPTGERLDWSMPAALTRLPDGSRVTAVIRPIQVDGAELVIRKFVPNVGMEQLVDWGSLPPELVRGLAACVKGRLNIVVSGGTGSGKTTMLNALSAFINKDLSIITIENPAELQLDHPRVRRWEARSANIEGKGEISMLWLVELALRARPDIIIVGEVRGKEAAALLEAMNTGHMGSMSTLHANNTQEATKRLVAMVASAERIATTLIPAYVASAVHLIVQINRMADNRRRVTEVAEVLGEENGLVITRPLVRFRTDRFEEGQIKGHWELCTDEFDKIDLIKGEGVEFPGFLDGKEQAFPKERKEDVP